jgi:hypothetical protein
MPTAHGTTPTEAPADGEGAGSGSSLQTEFNNDFSGARERVMDGWIAQGGVISKQRDAVSEFAEAIPVEDAPTFTETVLKAAITAAPMGALGGIGSVVGAAIVPGVSRSAVGATARSAAVAGTISNPAAADLGTAAVMAARAILAQAVDEGQSRVVSGISSRFAAHNEMPTSIQTFAATQRDLLDDIAQTQGAAMRRMLSAQPEATKWETLEALHDAIQAQRDQVEAIQWAKMTDEWFSMQTSGGIGAGARPGVLQIELDDAYPNHRGRFHITSANLLGHGSNEAVRATIARRKIEDIGMPMYIHMSGSMGHGVLDCDWGMRIAHDGGAPDSVTYNRWGDDWLAARALRRSDLDGDDPAVNDENIQAGADDVWQHIKGRTIASLGGTIDASTW